MTAVHAICVHGVGSGTPSNFADKAMKRLSAALAERGVTLYSRSVHWGPIMDEHERKMLEAVGRRGSENRPTQRAGIGMGGDALSYRHSQDAINYVFDYEVGALRADDFIIFAHSLGCVLATDWLRSRKLARCSKFVSMGCNLQAFNLGAEAQWPCPWQLSGPNAWVRQARDVEVSVGGWLTGWTGLSHTGYWQDRKLWTRTVPELLCPA
jgi:hypothetical protein